MTAVQVAKVLFGGYLEPYEIPHKNIFPKDYYKKFNPEAKHNRVNYNNFKYNKTPGRSTIPAEYASIINRYPTNRFQEFQDKWFIRKAQTNQQTTSVAQLTPLQKFEVKRGVTEVTSDGRRMFSDSPHHRGYTMSLYDLARQ